MTEYSQTSKIKWKGYANMSVRIKLFKWTGNARKWSTCAFVCDGDFGSRLHKGNLFNNGIMTTGLSIYYTGCSLITLLCLCYLNYIHILFTIKAYFREDADACISI